MDEFNNFDFECLQDDLCHFNKQEDLFSQLDQGKNLMNDFPSICEIDTTEAVKKKLENHSHQDKIKSELSLSPESDDPYLMNGEVTPEDESSLFVVQNKNEKPQEEEVEKNKETDACTLEAEELHFRNPVNYQKKERFSKKYDKGKLTLISFLLLMNLTYFFNENIK